MITITESTDFDQEDLESQLLFITLFYIYVYIFLAYENHLLQLYNKII